jgi:hypothetical protein
MPFNTRFIRAVAVGLLGLLFAMTALAIPLAETLYSAPVRDAPQPAPLAILAIVLLWLGALLNRAR